MKAMVVDVAKCNGCFSCQVVCKDEHCSQDWLPYAAAQPETGQFWMKVQEKVRGQVPVVKVAYTPRTCSHCRDCAMVEKAPDVAYRREDGLVIIDPEKAKGRKDLLDLCPSGAVYWNEELEIPQKCTGCAHLLDNGWEVPRCVDACSTDALRFGDEAELADLIAKAEPYPALAGHEVGVWYLNLPKRFIAACIVDFAADEVMIGADVEVYDAAGRVVTAAKTDEFGDVMFDGLEPGTYTLKCSLPGYAPLEVEADITDRDVTLGDLGVEKK